MKKSYSAPAIKTMRAFTQKVMDMEIGSNGIYEQGVGGEGSDNEARAEEMILF